MQVRIRIPRRKPRKLVSRNQSKRAGQTVVIIVLGAVFGSIYALLGESGMVSIMEMGARAAQLRHEISAKEQGNREMRDVIRPLREADPEAIERIAREKLYMVRPDDILYILPPESRPAPPVLNEPGSPTAPPVPSKR